MKVFSLVFALVLSVSAFAQPPLSEERFFARLKKDGPLPEKLLSTRSVVIYSYALKSKELNDTQASFKQTGIDAIAYFEMDLFLAGKDVSSAYSAYLIKRDISNLVFLSKNESGYTIYITTFSAKGAFVDENQNAWMATDPVLSELLKKIYRASGSLKNENFLVPDFPETDLSVNIINGRRSDFFSLDLKVDPLAVPKFGDENMDAELAQLFANYSYKFKLTEAGLSERELRRQGYLYVLCYANARGSVLRKILGYNTTKQESAYISVTFPGDQSQLKTIAADTPVYKFYFKHIESGNVFLGTKWDADVTWQAALKNHLMSFKTEVK